MATIQTISDIFDEVPGLKQDFKQDWKETSKKDWNVDWDEEPVAPVAPTVDHG